MQVEKVVPAAASLARLPKPLLLASAIVATLTALWLLPHAPALHALRTSAVPPRPGPAGGAVQRTPAEQAYLAGRFLPDFLALNRTARIFFVDLPAARYAFCSVAKNGCTFHMALIHRLHATGNWSDPEVVHNGMTNERWRAPSLPEDYVVSRLLDDAFPKYMIVRNPLARTLSAYRNKVEGPARVRPPDRVEMFHRWAAAEFGKGTGYSERQLGWFNPHWMPQYIHCGMHRARVFKTFRFEEPESYVEYLERLVPPSVLMDGWGRNNQSFREYQLGPRERTGNIDDLFLRYYNNTRVFDLVREFAKNDIEMFGYQVEVEEMRRAVLEKSGEAIDPGGAEGAGPMDRTKPIGANGKDGTINGVDGTDGTVGAHEVDVETRADRAPSSSPWERHAPVLGQAPLF